MKFRLAHLLKMGCLLVLLSKMSWPGLAESLTGGKGTLFIGTLPHHIAVIDEATEEIQERIALKTGIPRQLELSYNHRRFYVVNNTLEDIEIVDIASKQVVDTFSLSEGNRRVRIWHYQTDPLERYMFLVTRSYSRLMDRFEIGPFTLTQYDLSSHKIVATHPWPHAKERDCVRMSFSPDGGLLYLFFDEILIFDTAEFKQVGTWKLSQTVETGLGQIELSSECAVDVIHEAPGFVTDLFTVRDPVQNRRLMGVARLDLVKKNMDYFTVGPAQQVTFALGPNRLQAYGLLREINHYEFWGFDLANRRLRDRKEFPGRPRMKVKTSSNGKLLYIYEADDAIHIYNAASYEYLRTIHLDAYHRTALYVIPPK